jgi:hypothetical protein
MALFHCRRRPSPRAARKPCGAIDLSYQDYGAERGFVIQSIAATLTVPTSIVAPVTMPICVTQTNFLTESRSRGKTGGDQDANVRMTMRQEFSALATRSDS